MTTQHLIYRQASSDDLSTIIQLIHTCYQEYRADLSATNWERMKANLSNENQFSDTMKLATTFVCETENRLIGVVFLIPSGNPTRIFPAEWSYIRLLGVDPAYRGFGIGKALVGLCIDQAKRTGESCIALHTSEFMHTARRMYELLGFSAVKEIGPIYDKQYWLYRLTF